MVLIYRIEHAKGKYDGPYSYPIRQKWEEYADFETRQIKHLNPYDDPDLSSFWNELDYGIRQTYYFGFISIDQLKEWFFSPRMRSVLDVEGFVVNVYETDEFHHGLKQSIFVKSNSKIVETISLMKI